ncbi:MAG: hypothetical protein LDL53_02665, partial [Candidatus Hydrogenedens sp.]|nr:hypothetical protein [Candidatus Hydrogenedens sp.]
KMKRCALCNEYIEDIEFQFDEAIDLDGEYWHVGCYEEYFGEMPEITTSATTPVYNHTRSNNVTLPKRNQ